MNSNLGFLAIDLGAESGRVMLGLLDVDSGALRLQQAHRFSHEICHLPNGMYWNTTGIWKQILIGLQKGAQLAQQNSCPIISVGADTWGVDFGLLGKSDELLSLPRAYRDLRCQKSHKQLHNKLTSEHIYDATGIASMPINTLYQLHSLQQSEPAILENAHSLLFMPDLFHFFLSGIKNIESTICSTSQLTDARTGKWAHKLLKQAGIPTHMLCEISECGTSKARLGKLRPEISQIHTELKEVEVITPAGHDTASAVAGVPADKSKGEWCYLSSGTWSLIGAALDKPVINEKTRLAGFTNERGIGGTTRFLKNITGLWLVQECRRDYSKNDKDYDYIQLTEAAAEQQPFATLVDANHPPLLQPGDMLKKIADFAQSTNQPIPQSPGAFVRCCLESLALAYRQALEQMQQLLDKEFAHLHIVGGGAKNELLNQMTASAINRPVITGPYEATATGNILTQALGYGAISSADNISEIVRNSFDVKTVEPQPGEKSAWDSAYERYLALAK